MDRWWRNPAIRNAGRWFAWAAWLFDAESGSCSGFVPRWLFLRALGGIYCSAFFSLLFQIKGLNGPHGILPAERFLAALHGQIGILRFWYAPTLFWISAGSHMMMAVVWIGLAASVAVVVNLWPRVSLPICFVCFLSFVTAADAFSSYQSDSMLLEAGFLALFFAPGGVRPGFGVSSPTTRASLFLLQWEWFRIYLESGMVKLLSGDPQWRKFTAMDEYYQNGPLPTWIGWYLEHLPHWFHAATAAGTLVMELAIVWMLFLPRRVRIVCFFIVTPWEIGVILTANYTFLNYLVLALGFLLLDDRSLNWLLPRWLQESLKVASHAEVASVEMASQAQLGADGRERKETPAVSGFPGTIRVFRMCVTAVSLTWICYVTTAEMVRMLWPELPLPSAPIVALEPFRIANQYGLFAVMTRGRYEIEFQGSNDGVNWTPYRFRYKPQELNEAPGIYAPYQPRFDWNLWFASLGDWQQNNIVPLTEERLLENDADVLALFRGSPFAATPPHYVRAVLWQYRFTSLEEKRRTGNWWRRSWMGLYAPELIRQPDGKFVGVEWPEELSPHD